MNELIEYYVNLLIIQYNNKPKARETILNVITELIASGIYLSVQDGYDIETAVGVQLDVLGKYANINRFYKGLDFTGHFSFINYDEVAAPPLDRIGFSNYSDFDTKTGDVLNYVTSISEDLKLPDDDFRRLLKLRIIQNNSNHSHYEIDKSIFDAFSGSLLPDSLGNMIMDYFIQASLAPLAVIAQQKGVLPKPIGVRLNYFIEINQDFFGFTTYNQTAPANITGFANYADYDAKDGEILRFLKLTEI